MNQMPTFSGRQYPNSLTKVPLSNATPIEQFNSHSDSVVINKLIRV